MQDAKLKVIDIIQIRDALDAGILVGETSEETYITGIYASDLMSDVLAYGTSGSALLTGLNSVQAVISAYMAEFKGIIFIRSKTPGNDTLNFAKEKGMFVMTTQFDMYEACIKIAGIEGEAPEIIKERKVEEKSKNIASHSFTIDGQDFASAGMVSTQIKAILKSIGYDPGLIRRVAISTYEAEMNVVMHAKKADVTLTASDKEIYILVIDEGKGIKDIELAMKEGYSTATEEQRALGFGAGMGLPNIKKNSDAFEINSVVDVGTRLEISFNVK